MKHMFTFFEDFAEGADFYQNNGSLWLIFTEQKKWVFELTKDGTLWYNYYFFDKIFSFASLGLIENQNYITKWVENFIQNGVKHTEYGDWLDGDERLDDIIENGVKQTNMEEHHRLREVVRTLKDGVKETNWRCVDNHPTFVDSLIESGVNETWGYERQPQNRINEVIENGTKENPS